MVEPPLTVIIAPPTGRNRSSVTTPVTMPPRTAAVMVALGTPRTDAVI